MRTLRPALSQAFLVKGEKMDAKKPLMQILCHPVLGRPSTIRVYPDGLYLYRLDDQPWQEVWSFAENEMAELREAIARSGFFELPEDIRPELPIRDGTFATWTITSSGKTHHVRVAPGAQVEALENVFHTFTRLRKQTPERSEWEVRLADGRVREFTVLGCAHAVAWLSPLAETMLKPGSPHERTGAAKGPALVKTRWFSATGIQETVFFQGGLFTRCCDGGKVEKTFHTQDQVRLLADKISAIDWDSIPEHIDTMHR